MDLVGQVSLRHKEGELIRKRTFFPPETISFGHIYFKVLVLQIIAADLSVPFHVFTFYLLARASIFLGIFNLLIYLIGILGVFEGVISDGFVQRGHMLERVDTFLEGLIIIDEGILCILANAIRIDIRDIMFDIRGGHFI